MVDVTAPLNQRQIQVLRWIGDGCPDGVMTGHTHKTTAVALQGRRLAVVSRRRGVWSADITDTGRYYLEHGDFPPKALGPHRRPAAKRDPTARTSRSSITSRGSVPTAAKPALSRGTVPSSSRQASDDGVKPAREGAVDRLIRQLKEVGGRIHVEAPTWVNNRCIGVDYGQLIKAANRTGKVPAGQRILSRDHGRFGMDIWLAPAIPGTQVQPRPVPVPTRVTRYHPVVTAYRDRRDRHEISKAHQSRALLILQALITEAERRGFHATLTDDRAQRSEHYRWAASRDGHIAITVDGHPQPLRLLEIGMPSRSAWNANHYRQLDTYFTNTGTGRLRLEMAGYGGVEGRVFRWSDGERTRLEDKLPAVLAEIEIRAAEGAHRDHERQAQQDARRAEEEQAERRAAARALEKGRADALLDQLHRWETARRLRGYLTALEEALEQRQRSTTGTDTEPPPAADVIRWLNWARQYTEQLDPLHDLPTMPDPTDSRRTSFNAQ
jgi:hypothetical protein